jgi:hypothetical protein
MQQDAEIQCYVTICTRQFERIEALVGTLKCQWALPARNVPKDNRVAGMFTQVLASGVVS